MSCCSLIGILSNQPTRPYGPELPRSTIRCRKDSLCHRTRKHQPPRRPRRRSWGKARRLRSGGLSLTREVSRIPSNTDSGKRGSDRTRFLSISRDSRRALILVHRATWHFGPPLVAEVRVGGGKRKFVPPSAPTENGEALAPPSFAQVRSAAITCCATACGPPRPTAVAVRTA